MIQENNVVPKKAVNIMDDTKPDAAVVEHKFEAVVDGGVSLKKQSGIGKFFRQLFAEDMRTVRQTFKEDVLIPFLQDGISGIFHDGIDLLIYGKGYRRGRLKGSMFGNMKTRYNDKYKSSIEGSRIRRRSDRDDYDDEDDDEVSLFEDNILKITGDIKENARHKAERILNTLSDALEQFPSVSVSDLYDVAGITNIKGDFIDKNWGWTDLRDARIRRISNNLCYLIMPKLEDIRDT